MTMCTTLMKEEETLKFCRTATIEACETASNAFERSKARVC